MSLSDLALESEITVNWRFRARHRMGHLPSFSQGTYSSGTVANIPPLSSLRADRCTNIIPQSENAIYAPGEGAISDSRRVNTPKYPFRGIIGESTR